MKAHLILIRKKYCLSGKLISQNELLSVICKTTIPLTAALKNSNLFFFFFNYCKLWERRWFCSLKQNHVEYKSDYLSLEFYINVWYGSLLLLYVLIYPTFSSVYICLFFL